MLSLTPGRTFAGCKIISLCGSGGFGAVLLATDTLGRKVALKLVSAIDTERELKGIRTYIRTAEKEQHLLKIYYAGIENGQLYYLMEAADPLNQQGIYIPKTLSNVLKTTGRIEPDKALAMISGLAEGICELHKAGLIHRDIKPSNIIFVNDIPKLSDPGLVCSIEQTISLAGTLGFLPPECFSGEVPNDMSSDIYALGKVFYCSITGEPPGHYPRLPRDLSTSICRRIYPILLKACNSVRKKRCKTIQEFKNELPERLPKISSFEKRMDDFRTWRLMHPGRWRAIFCSILLLLLAGPSTIIYPIMEHKAKAAHAERCRKKAEDFIAKIHSGGNLLMIQLEKYAGQDFRSQVSVFSKTKIEYPIAASETAHDLERKIIHTAYKIFPPFEKPSDKYHALLRSGMYRAALDSPLGHWAPERFRKDYKKKLDQFEHKYCAGENGSPVPGRKWYMDGSETFAYVYVPPGEFRSPSKKKICKIDYPFWAAELELRTDCFSRSTGFIPTTKAQTFHPATCILWNDVLKFAQASTLKFQNNGNLPPGYIVRPMTVLEWEWCALGGWGGNKNATVWDRKTAKETIQRVGSSAPNSLGMYDMIGNAYEMVTEDRKTLPPNMIRICGGSVRDSKISVYTSMHIPYYQSLLDYVGTRLVIAPGDMSFFDKEFRAGEPMHLEFDGRHFEFLGGNAGGYTLDGCKVICEALGGHLAIVDSKELLKSLMARFNYINSLPTIVGAEWKGDAWYWHNGQKLSDGFKKPQTKQTSIVLLRSKLQTSRVSPLPAFICEWTKEEWVKRPQRIEGLKQSPLLRHQFVLDNRQYAVIQLYSLPHTARRFAELLGGHLALPRDERFRKRLAEKLGRWNQEALILDGYNKYGKWVFHDGSTLEADLRNEGGRITPSMAISSPALKQGELCNIQLARFLLIEWDNSFSKSSTIN